jgi:uncharacterized membrane protein YgdD (TMEM256/DUF423 family)
MAKHILILACVNGFLVVSIGAFGAHGLESLLGSAALATYETGVDYHMFHTLALFGCGLLAVNHPDSVQLKFAARLFLLGIIFFAGSLYLLSVTGISWLGAITPIGGVGFLGGWTCLGWFATTQKPSSAHE